MTDATRANQYSIAILNNISIRQLSKHHNSTAQQSTAKPYQQYPQQLWLREAHQQRHRSPSQQRNTIPCTHPERHHIDANESGDMSNRAAYSRNLINRIQVSF